MAVFADPEGAVFCVWQAKAHKGARIVNEPGTLNFNNLNTRDPESTKSFYGSLFGWETLALGGGAEMWTLPGGQVLVAPFDAPWVRSTVIADPQGASFIASKFVPENRDLAGRAA